MKNRLWANSGNRCAFTGCSEILSREGNDLDGPATVGRIAHIYAHSADGPRPAPDGFPAEEIDREGNLLLLCSNHHALIDDHELTYTADTLRRMKSTHEERMESSHQLAVFGSLELATIITWISDYSDLESSEDYDILEVAEKINYNDLSNVVAERIEKGISKEYQVREYIKNCQVTDKGYPERLLVPLRSRYDDNKALGWDGDSIFDDLWLFAYGNRAVERAGLMQLLESHRALDEYNHWQALSLKQISDLEDIERQLKKRKQIDNEKAEIKAEKALLTIDALRDLEERDSKSQAARIFNESCNYLYDEPGAFIVEINTETGIRFSVDIAFR